MDNDWRMKWTTMTETQKIAYERVYESARECAVPHGAAHKIAMAAAKKVM